MKSMSLSVLLLGTALLGMYQGDRLPAAPAEPAAKERQFDFWLGEWDVQTLGGQAAGRNRITLRDGKRVLLEEWQGARGTRGTSLNMYDPATDRWHQTWMDDSGLLLLLDGGLQEDGSMRMEGERTTSGRSTVRDRIRWTPAEGGRVRQTWESSSNGGLSWQTVADLIYLRRREER